MSPSAQPRVLVSRALDGWLVGWLAVLVWVVAFVLTRTGLPTGVAAFVPAVYWTGAVVSAAHFGLSYHLAYCEGPAGLRTRPVALIWAPLMLAGVLTAIVAVSLAGGARTVHNVTGALITSVYLMTTWHYVKQVYGVGRVGAAFAGVTLGTRDVRVLRYGLYPLWFLGAAQVLVRDTGYGLAGFHVGFGVLPPDSLHWLRALAVISAVPVAAVFARLAVTRRAWPPGLLVAPYVATFLWLGLPTDAALTLLLLAPFHALQYLAVGHRAEVNLAAGRPGEHGLMWWLNIFVGAACGGLLLSRWLPQLLDQHVRPADGGPLLFAAAFFVFLNLHHYLIDASIWRSKGELVKAIVRGPSPAMVGEARAKVGV